MIDKKFEQARSAIALGRMQELLFALESRKQRSCQWIFSRYRMVEQSFEGR